MIGSFAKLAVGIFFIFQFSGCGIPLTPTAVSGASAQKADWHDDSSLVYPNDSVFTKAIERGEFDFNFQNWNDPLFFRQWYLRNSGQEIPPSGEGLTGADIHVPETLPAAPSETILALIDSGVDASHPDLDSGRMFRNPGEQGMDHLGLDKGTNGIDDDQNGFIDDVSGWSFADDSRDQKDALGHGTHLAGLLIAKSNNAFGISAPWSAFKILPVQIFSGAHPSLPAEKVARAIRYAVDMGARVISASFGSPSYSESIFQALSYARQRDVLVVSAVGNLRRDIDLEPSYPASFRLENQISVAASEHRDLAALFSNFGRNVDIFAPGDLILSTAPQGEFAVRSGTSQACPLVAAVAAELRARFPGKSSAEIKQQIIEAGDESLGLMGFSRNGRRLNFSNALAATAGRRIPVFRDEQFIPQNYVLESEHPYRSHLNKTYQISLAPEIRAFRLHFERFSTQSTDVLSLRRLDGRVIQQWSGELGSFTSAVIDGSTVLLDFRTDYFVSDWGWKIDRIELIAP